MSSNFVQHTRSIISRELPRKVTWHTEGMTVHIDFSRSDKSLKPIDQSEVNCVIPDEWKKLYLFGEEDYAEGAGAHPWLGVNKATGKIYGLDLERPEPVYFLNSDIEKYIKTFLLFDAVIRTGKYTDTSLSADLVKIDTGYARSDWQKLTDYLQDST